MPTARIRIITVAAPPVVKMVVSNATKHHAQIARVVSVLQVAVKTVFVALGKTVMRAPMAVVKKGTLEDMADLPNTV